MRRPRTRHGRIAVLGRPPPATLDLALSAALNVLTRSGIPLDGATQAHLTAGFGQSFATVRVRDGAEAASAAASVGALAYTVGNAMVFGRGQYQPGTSAGLRLIAHEAAHVVQQRSGRVAAVSAPTVGAADSPFKWEAERAADAVTAGQRPSGMSAATSPALGRRPVGPGPHWVQRQADTVAGDRHPVEEQLSGGMEVIDSRAPEDLPMLAFNDPSEKPTSEGGHPVYKVRSNYTEQCACLACPSQAAPSRAPPAR